MIKNCTHCGQEIKKGEEFLIDNHVLCNDCKQIYNEYEQLVHIEHDKKNDHILITNHNIKVYCPFCGQMLCGDKTLSNRFCDEGYGDAMNEGVICNTCNICVYTYKVEKL